MKFKAKQRAELIFQVRSGQMTATAAARSLGISRQQYYQWEKRALKGLMQALEDQPTGRPKIPKDPEKLALHRRIKQLELQVEHQQQKARLRQLLDQWTAKDKRPPTKKKPK